MGIEAFLVQEVVIDGAMAANRMKSAVFDRYERFISAMRMSYEDESGLVGAVMFARNRETIKPTIKDQHGTPPTLSKLEHFDDLARKSMYDFMHKSAQYIVELIPGIVRGQAIKYQQSVLSIFSKIKHRDELVRRFMYESAVYFFRLIPERVELSVNSINDQEQSVVVRFKEEWAVKQQWAHNLKMSEQEARRSLYMAIDYLRTNFGYNIGII